MPTRPALQDTDASQLAHCTTLMVYFSRKTRLPRGDKTFSLRPLTWHRGSMVLSSGCAFFVLTLLSQFFTLPFQSQTTELQSIGRQTDIHITETCKTKQQHYRANDSPAKGQRERWSRERVVVRLVLGGNFCRCSSA
ncbi:hypothetical protein E2C01_046338 [Portunus trituberculatus]|uniref:Uncharacterized protein n=1 Tax=Portunus trituberculatus TaxID=210409 RepID=A0A5B7G5Q9_PORTR|nr:hypothetical protein [Portunus trituberculatus]